MHRAKDGTTLQACLMRADDFALAGCRAIGPAFSGGWTAADPNDWSERQPAEQPSAGLEHSGRSPFQIAARQEMLLQSADRHRTAAQCRPRRAISYGQDRLRRNHEYCREV